MATVNEIYQYLDEWAPFVTQMSFDNAGLLVGRRGMEVHRVLVALDITPEVAMESARLGAQLIVAHHPVIFDPLRALTDDTMTGRTVLSLAEHKIAALCAHTNLDAAEGGVNDQLADMLLLSGVEHLHADGVDAKGRTYGIGRVGSVHQAGMTAEGYAAFVKARLDAGAVRLSDGGRPVCRVAVGGGSCGSMLSDVAAAGCDTFVTSDVKYDVFLAAKDLGINLIDAGHYATEQVVCPALAERISRQFPALEVMQTQVHGEILKSM